jgi:salicylate hydroxylase
MADNIKKELKICVIGAGRFTCESSVPGSVKANPDLGMGGLCCALALAHYGFENIEVFETASNLGFVGAGIQLAPNMSRILDRLGVWKEIEREAVLVKETSIRGM